MHSNSPTYAAAPHDRDRVGAGDLDSVRPENVADVEGLKKSLGYGTSLSVRLLGVADMRHFGRGEEDSAAASA